MKAGGGEAVQGRWRAVAEWPPVALALALAIFLGAAGVAAGLIEVAMRGAPANHVQIVTDAVSCVVMLLAYKLVIRRLGRKPRDDLAGPRAGRQVLAGTGIGFLLFSAIVAVAALMGVYRINGTGNADFLLFALVTDGFAPAIGEELLFRGILFRWLEEWSGSAPALVVSSLLFGASHLQNPGASWLAAIGIALEGGLLLGAAYVLTRRLWMPMGLHAAWNLTQGEVFDVPVSGNDAHGLLSAQLGGPELLTGGGFGLEASLISISIATAFGLALFALAARERRLVPVPWFARRSEAVRRSISPK
jgi:membrane protease YdiL (CAAX protease family)